MKEEWNSAQLRNHIDLLTGFPFKSKCYSDDEHGTKLVRGDNVVQGRFRWDSVKRWPENELNEKHQQYWLKDGDVILAMDRPWIEVGLKTAQIHSFDLPCLLVQRVSCLRAKEGLDQNFLRYVISSYWFTEYVKLIQTGTAVPHISSTQILDFEFKKPPLYEQEVIAHILGTLDDKIELNRQMNETLEGMAQALFKSWFVDFDPVIDNALAAGNKIPDALKARAEVRKGIKSDSAEYCVSSTTIRQQFPSAFQFHEEIGWLPEGWEPQPVYDIAQFINGTAFRKFNFSTESDALPVVKIAELKNGVTGQTKFTNSKLDKRYFLDNGDILFSWSGNPDTSIDTFVWSGGKGWLNQHIFKVSLYSETDRCFVYYLLKHLKPVFAEIARDKQTTGLGHITAKDMKRLAVPKPKEEIIKYFQSYAKPFFEKWYANTISNYEIEDLRDTLLPKLLSGELRIPDAEKLVSQVL